MATVVSDTQPVETSIWDNMPSLTTIIIVGILVLLGIVIYYFWKKLEEERKLKEDHLFYDYISTKEGCTRMAQQDLKRFGFNWWFLLFPPLFFLGFVIKRDLSVPVKDLNNKLLGRYRGEQQRNDNTYNLLLSRGKKLGLFEDLVVIKFLRGIRDSDGRYHDLTKLIHYFPTKENCKVIRLDCYDIEEYKYFQIPHIIDDEGASLPMRTAIARVFKDITNDYNITEYLREGSQQIAGAFKLNSDLGYRQREPQEKQEIVE